MGILDMFDDPGLLSTLGLSSPGAPQQPQQPPPMPPPQVMANAAPGFAPGSTAGAPPMVGGAGVANPQNPMMPQPNMGWSGGDPTNPAAAAGAPNPGAAPDWLRNGGPVDRGMPFTRPVQTMPTGSPVAPDGGNNTAQGDSGAGGGADGGGVPVAPLGARRPPMPPPLGANGPPTMANGGGLAGALGLNQGGLRSAIEGAGKGFSAVGALPSGASRGRAIATGLGGGVQGNIADQDTQRNQNRQDKNDLFSQSSTAFKDMLAADAADDTSKLRDAQGKLAIARATALMTASQGNAGSKAWMNTPQGRVMYAEGYIQKFRDQQRKIAETNAKQTGQPVDEDKINRDAEAYRTQLYRDWKIDPKSAEKMGDGTAAGSAFDTKGMTQEVFDAVVPMGGWYKDQNGTPRQRTKPPGQSRSQAAGSALASDNAMDVAGGAGPE